MRIRTLTLALAAAGLSLAAAQAQPFERGRGGVAILFEQPDFQGRQVVIRSESANLSAFGFNDRARSARFQGTWRVCEHANFGGRCEDLRGDAPDLNRYALAERISSLQPAGRIGRDDDWDRGGDRGWDRGWEREARGIEGDRSVFFPRPRLRGLDVAAGSNGANSFCRLQGLGPAVYYDSSARAPRAVGPEGQVTGPSTVLRDLLCRRF